MRISGSAGTRPSFVDGGRGLLSLWGRGWLSYVPSGEPWEIRTKGE